MTPFQFKPPKEPIPVPVTPILAQDAGEIAALLGFMKEPIPVPVTPTLPPLAMLEDVFAGQPIKAPVEVLDIVVPPNVVPKTAVQVIDLVVPPNFQPVVQVTAEVARMSDPRNMAQMDMQPTLAPQMEAPDFDWPDLPVWEWPGYPTWDWPEIPRPEWVWLAVPRPSWLDSMQVPRPGWLGELLSWSPEIVITSGRPATPAPGNAAGTPYWKGGLTWVGEQGPELVNLPRGSAVYSNAESQGMAGGVVIQNLHVHNDMDIIEVARKVVVEIDKRGRRG